MNKVILISLLMLTSLSFSDAPVEIGRENVSRIADELAALQRFVYKRFGGDPAYQEAGINPPEDPSHVMFLEKIQTLSTRLSEITGQLEELQHQILDAPTLIEKIQTKVEEKIEALERKLSETSETVKKAEHQGYHDKINKMTVDELLTHIETSGRLLAEELFEKALQLFIKKFGKDHRITSIYKELVYLTYKKEDYKGTALYAGEFYKKAPTAPETPEILLMMAFALSRLEKTKEACMTLSKLRADYPNTSDDFKERLDVATVSFACPA